MIRNWIVCLFIAATTYYNATLNQTNIGHNNNKYYVMQVLEPDNMDGNGYCVWFRWGRVGKPYRYIKAIFLK